MQKVDEETCCRRRTYQGSTTHHLTEKAKRTPSRKTCLQHVFAGASTRVKLSRAAGYSTDHPPKNVPHPTSLSVECAFRLTSSILRQFCNAIPGREQGDFAWPAGRPSARNHSGSALARESLLQIGNTEVEVNIGPCCVSQVAGEVSEQSAAKRISGCIYATASSPPKVKFSVPWFGLSLFISLPFLVSGGFCRGFELGLPNRFDMIGSFARSAFPQ